jgi:hypothetical protein
MIYTRAKRWHDSAVCPWRSVGPGELATRQPKPRELRDRGQNQQASHKAGISAYYFVKCAIDPYSSSGSLARAVQSVRTSGKKSLNNTPDHVIQTSALRPLQS